MSKTEIIEKYWLDFISWSHWMALNQVGHGKFPYPHNDLFMKPTEQEFWVWYVREKLKTAPKEDKDKP
jgi:hypothetical protein